MEDSTAKCASDKVPCDYSKDNRLFLKQGHQKFDQIDKRLRTVELDGRETKVMTELMFRKGMDDKTIKHFDDNRNPHVSSEEVMKNFNKESKKRQAVLKRLYLLIGIITAGVITYFGILNLF